MVQVTSAYAVGVTQADGRIPITETHVAGGVEYVYEYLSDGTLSPQVIMEERAAHVKATLEEREAARTLANNSAVAVSKIDFLNRFTAAERIAAKAAAITDSVVADYLLLLENADTILVARAVPGLQYLYQIGVLTAERAAEIGAE